MERASEDVACVGAGRFVQTWQADVNIDKQAYGFGLRFHSRRATFARFDMARADEGWRFLLRLSDPLHFTRLSRRVAAISFVP